MVTQDELQKVCDGLQVLMKQYKNNSRPGDKDRYKATEQAYAALRKVILVMAIQGDLKMIAPIKQGDKCGWKTVSVDGICKNY